MNRMETVLARIVNKELRTQMEKLCAGAGITEDFYEFWQKVDIYCAFVPQWHFLWMSRINQKRVEAFIVTHVLELVIAMQAYGRIAATTGLPVREVYDAVAAVVDDVVHDGVKPIVDYAKKTVERKQRMRLCVAKLFSSMGGVQ